MVTGLSEAEESMNREQHRRQRQEVPVVAKAEEECQLPVEQGSSHQWEPKWAEKQDQ